MGIGVQVFGPLGCRGKIGEPVRIPKDQHRAIHVLLQLPGGRRVGFVPIIIIFRTFKFQTDHLAILDDQVPGSSDKPAGRAQLVFVLNQQQVGFRPVLRGAQDGGQRQRRRLTVLH